MSCAPFIPVPQIYCPVYSDSDFIEFGDVSEGVGHIIMFSFAVLYLSN